MNNLGTILQLEVINSAMFSADFDLDGDVDGDDLNVWQAEYGAGNGADADGDGDSDGFDFLAWQQQQGSGVPLAANFSAVPEPNTICLLVGSCLLAVLRRK